MEEKVDLPKKQQEFQNKLNIHNSYVEVLKNYHTDLLEKVKKSKKGYQRSKLEVDLFELSQKLDGNINALKALVQEYNDTFVKKEKKE